MSYSPEPGIHIRNKIKLELDLSNYATKKELEHETGIDTSDLAAIKRFYCFKSRSWQTR